MDSGGGKTVGKGLKTEEEDKDRREEGVGRKKKKKKKMGGRMETTVRDHCQMVEVLPW